MELKAKLWSSRLSLYPVGLLMYWIALNTCTNPEESRKKDGIEYRERKRADADELGLMELKAKLVSAGLLMYWIALDSCTRRKRKKEGRKREREKEKEKERRGR